MLLGLQVVEFTDPLWNEPRKSDVMEATSCLTWSSLSSPSRRCEGWGTATMAGTASAITATTVDIDMSLILANIDEQNHERRGQPTNIMLSSRL